MCLRVIYLFIYLLFSLTIEETQRYVQKTNILVHIIVIKLFYSNIKRHPRIVHLLKLCH